MGDLVGEAAMASGAMLTARAEVFAVIEQRVRRQVEEIAAEKARGETVWPVIDYADIAAGTVPPDQLAKLRQRGCLIVRGHFGREQALGWDRDIIDYVESNRFFETYQGPADDFFGSVGSKPEIYPIYWSPAQMQARQSDRMARAQAFLNAQWTSQSGGVRWFDPSATRSTRTASAAAPRVPTPAAWAPTSTREPVHKQQGWGNVMYIPAAPWCPRNERYAAAVREAFLTGSSPRDFPDENYERDWPNRFGPGDLNETGRRGLGLA